MRRAGKGWGRTCADPARSARCHGAQAAPKVIVRVLVIDRVRPAGQVTVPACSSMVKSSMVNPPGTAGPSGPGLITVS